MDKKSKANQIFLNLSMCCAVWAFGYAMMLTCENINIAFFWRAVSIFGYCFFSGYWLYFAFVLNNEKENKYNRIIIILAHVPAALLFMLNIMVEPSSAMIRRPYGWIDVAPNLFGQIAYSICSIIFYVLGLVMLFNRGRYSKILFYLCLEFLSFLQQF
ncbi:hypothetical protein BJV38_001997 [Clostridium beijerinckii]|uniref:histidine kinase N-terminal 7TM domain-containing protein n=1 Tax=Clostridium beijerinckii TaxID=1520 RepID=UPI001F4C2A44|nr:histidine kinase N-terminal 7TM domain-containing protein [Clostridium beijerinckii]NRT35417.1 hypothetical protein [Clostridium beijerinckii]NRT45154.1 hypothetical protein [Clostridium beijerinckii]NRZ20849.1 hypothetical protein [Clostridium beijerinckii]